MSRPSAEFEATVAALRELRQIQRELAERELVRRADALDEVQKAVEHLAEIGSSAGILDRAAATLGKSSRFERVLVSQVEADRLVPRSVWGRAPIEPELVVRLQGLEIVLRYPLFEAEVSLKGSEAGAVSAAGPRSPAELRDLLAWDAYVLAPLRLQGRTIGILHAEPGRTADFGTELNLEIATIFAKGLAATFERAVLRETIERHRGELQSAVTWIDDHLGRDLAGLPISAADTNGAAAGGAGEESLTRREAEVLERLGRGQTNAAIAASLLISESTVKFHVKNILLKLGATSRADAVARHLRGRA